MTALAEAVEVVYRLLSGAGEGFEGRVFRLAGGTCLRYRVHRRSPPLLLGAWGPRGAALAGRIANELKVGGSANPAMVPVIRDRLAVGAESVDRDPAEVGLVFGAVTVVDPDGAAARARARTEVAMYLAVVAELDPTTQLPTDLLGRVQARALLDAGVRRVEFGTPHGLTDQRGVDLLGSAVLPQLRR